MLRASYSFYIAPCARRRRRRSSGPENIPNTCCLQARKHCNAVCCVCVQAATTTERVDKTFFFTFFLQITLIWENYKNLGEGLHYKVCVKVGRASASLYFIYTCTMMVKKNFHNNTRYVRGAR